MLNYLRNLRGKGLKTRLLNPIDAFYDYIFGVNTFATKKYSGDLRDSTWQSDYVPTSYKDIFILLKQAGLDKNSVIIDFGCGLGRVSFAAAYLNAKQSIGVEFDEGLFLAAESNKAKSKFKNKTIFVHQDASFFSIPNEANIFFFFNPFGFGTMEEVIKRIEQSIQTSPRRIVIIYSNPLFQNALKASSTLKLTNEWPAGKTQYPAQIWTN
jgi:precorrin-6B methylase 2